VSCDSTTGWPLIWTFFNRIRENSCEKTASGVVDGRDLPRGPQVRRHGRETSGTLVFQIAGDLLANFCAWIFITLLLF
jgi:hypothetical protein